MPKTTSRDSLVLDEKETIEKTMTYFLCCERVEGAFEGALGGVCLRCLKLLKVRLREYLKGV